MKKWSSIISLAVIVTLLAGCSLPGLGGKENVNSTPQTLKVMYYDESSFYQEYGMLYSALNPDVKIEIVSTNNMYRDVEPDSETNYEDLFAEFIEKEKPDIILADSYTLPKSIEKGLFYDLDAYVSQDSYDLQGLGTGVVDYMKDLGNGILYGIPTSIHSQVIYYNKDLFAEYGVPLPTDNMTWTELIALANMFPTDGEYPDRVYGLRYGYSNSLSDLIMQLSSAQGLQTYNSDTLTMTIDTPAWRELIEQALNLYKSGALYSDELRWNYMPEDGQYIDHYASEPLLNGITAMLLESSYYLSELKYTKDYSQNPENLTENWDIVSAPVTSTGSNASASTYYGNILSIYSGSTNLDAAWDFVSYVTGDEYARVKSYATYGNLPIRKKYALTDSTKNVDAFYATRPIIDNDTVDWNKIPQRFSTEFYNIQYEEYNKLQEGNATVEEVLSTLQLKGNELLATGVMTQEEVEKYYQEFYGEDYYGGPRAVNSFVDDLSFEEAEVEVETTEEVAE